MYWLAALSVALGVLCGAIFRLLVFAVILVAAVTSMLAIGWAGVASLSPLSALVALVALQIGYALGVILRAVLRALPSCRDPAQCWRRVPRPTARHRQR
jgi:hypothetical protein